MTALRRLWDIVATRETWILNNEKKKQNENEMRSGGRKKPNGANSAAKMLWKHEAAIVYGAPDTLHKFTYKI